MRCVAVAGSILEGAHCSFAFKVRAVSKQAILAGQWWTFDDHPWPRQQRWWRSWNIARRDYEDVRKMYRTKIPVRKLGKMAKMTFGWPRLGKKNGQAGRGSDMM